MRRLLCGDDRATTRADLARIDRKRKKKDGRTHLAHKAEHAIALDTGAIVGVTVPGADEGDTTTIQETLPEAAEQLEAVAAVTDDAVAVIEEVVADKGYHSRNVTITLRSDRPSVELLAATSVP